ncbi:hypothetical protein [Vulcanisaeta sp. JCM 14467]|uniref:hypothetical protein n=1 Tax=Vulcanisaeta sp. JCM 14467 TaxID=1295370 RepID=UPI0006D1D9D1|nr:hypothetical protein [Vulcanisaeta sp. JCM 14467]
MSEKKPEEKQVRRPPYQQYPAYSQQYQLPPPPPRQTPVTRPVTQQPRIEELAPSLSKLVLYLGIPLALITIVFVITAIALFPTTSDAYVPYSSIAFMASLITVAAALIVSFIAMYQIAMGLDRRFEYLTRIIRQQSSAIQTTPTMAALQHRNTRLSRVSREY